MFFYILLSNQYEISRKLLKKMVNFFDNLVYIVPYDYIKIDIYVLVLLFLIKPLIL